jgi:rRNA maturation RNase YbeY
VDTRLLRKIAFLLLVDLLRAETFDLAIYILSAPEMTRLNEAFLKHRGSTDVLTFDYLEQARRGALAGEIFVCVDEAFRQGARYRTTWQSEMVRYTVHGALHLMGYDDHSPSDRRKMKREENRLMNLLEVRFPFSALGQRNAAMRLEHHAAST